ncbi:MAG: hypothetical protein M1833_001255 [Piccolia ochrophora]|nr:MAG: hypothetical protein M1833_001255 [Piccolia ochrophora]
MLQSHIASAGQLQRRASPSASPTSEAFEAAASVSSESTSQKSVESEKSSAKEDASASASTSGSTKPEETSSSTSKAPSATSKPDLPDDVDVCHSDADADQPFCLPKNMSDVYVGDTYYVTWDPDAFPVNTSLILLLDYANASTPDLPSAGRNAWTAPTTPVSYGFTSVTMDESWLRSLGRNNLTFRAQIITTEPEEAVGRRIGPTVSLIEPPKQHYPAGPPTAPPNRLGLIVGLPVSLTAVAVLCCGLAYGMRKKRRIGLGSVMGRGRGGYGVGKSRRQRMRGARRGARGSGAIRLDDDIGAPPTPRDGGFRDEPLGGGVERSPTDAAARDGRREGTGDGSVGATDGHDGFRDYRDPAGGNAFRSEVDRQRDGRL